MFLFICLCSVSWALLSRHFIFNNMAHLFPLGSPGTRTAMSPRALVPLTQTDHHQDVTSPSAATLSDTSKPSTTSKQRFPPSATNMPPTIAAGNYNATVDGDNRQALKAARDLAASQTTSLRAAAAAAASELYQLEEALQSPQTSSTQQH